MASSMSRGNAGHCGPEDSVYRTRVSEKNTMVSKERDSLSNEYVYEQAGTSTNRNGRKKRDLGSKDNSAMKKRKDTIDVWNKGQRF